MIKSKKDPIASLQDDGEALRGWSLCSMMTVDGETAVILERNEME